MTPEIIFQWPHLSNCAKFMIKFKHWRVYNQLDFSETYSEPSVVAWSCMQSTMVTYRQNDRPTEYNNPLHMRVEGKLDKLREQLTLSWQR